METSNPGGGLVNGVPIGGNTPVTSIQVNTPADTATSGMHILNTIYTTTSPPTSSTNTSIGLEVKNTYTGPGVQASGGYPNALLVTEDINTTATIDKMVALVAKLDFLAAGNTKFGIGIEPVVSSIAVGALIDLCTLFLTPNLSGLTNRNLITQFFAHLNQDTNSMWMNFGPTLDSDYKYFAPSMSAGIIAGRIYSAHYSGINGGNVVASTIYCTPVYIPERITINTLGMNVTGFTAGKGRLALYKSSAGGPGALVAQGAAEIDTGTSNGDRTVSIATQVNPGLYYICAMYNAAPSVALHSTSIMHTAIHGMSSSTSATPESIYINYTYGVFPASLTGQTINRLASGTEPHQFYQL